MDEEQARERARRFSETVDYRDISDAAHDWASCEIGKAPMPEDLGAWAASLEIAFDAGQIYRAAMAGKE